MTGSFYVFGWFTKMHEGEPLFYMNGNFFNFHSDMAFFPKRGWGIAVVINYGGGLTIPHILDEPVHEVFRLAI
ncbi:hypothetical protein ACFL1N_08765 [Thermodesulfobacteriota bacterium]